MFLWHYFLIWVDFRATNHLLCEIGALGTTRCLPAAVRMAFHLYLTNTWMPWLILIGVQIKSSGMYWFPKKVGTRLVFHLHQTLNIKYRSRISLNNKNARLGTRAGASYAFQSLRKGGKHTSKWNSHKNSGKSCRRTSKTLSVPLYRRRTESVNSACLR